VTSLPQSNPSGRDTARPVYRNGKNSSQSDSDEDNFSKSNYKQSQVNELMNSNASMRFQSNRNPTMVGRDQSNNSHFNPRHQRYIPKMN
jgi:hypothetical protein